MTMDPISVRIIQAAIEATATALNTHPYTDDSAAQGLIEINARNVFRLVAAAHRDLETAEHAEAVFYETLARLSRPQQDHANS